MRRNRILSVLAVWTAVLVLASFSFWAAVGVQAEPAADLELISEETGFVAARSPLSPDCFFDQGYTVYLCEPVTPAERAQSNPAARAVAMNLLGSDTGALFIINSTLKQLMVFDAVTGDLVDPAFIQLDDDATGTAIHAIIGSNGTILISDQTRDVVHEYDLDGNYLGIFAPTGGANTDILDNIRGMALRPNGNLLVTVASSANANSVAEFDPAGNYLGNFIDNGSGGLSSPFDVYERPSVDWLVSSIGNNQILSYEWANGDPIGQFAPISSFPQQIYDIDNGNVLVANFSGTVGVHEFTSDGTLVGVYNPPGVSGNRGVFELPNGNILTSSGGGVFEIDRAGNLVETKYSGVARFIELVSIQSLDFNKTVGLDSSVCADTSEISVAPDTAVTYCFEITNNTAITLTQHGLIDSHLGVILDDFGFTLTPGASIFLTQTAVITQTTTNTATWTAYNPGPVDIFESTDTATVTVVPPSISLAKTVGTDSSACATTSEIDVAEGTAVTYCFEVTNTGQTTLAFHDLEDSELGELLTGLPFNLLPGASAFITQTAVITQTTTNTALWTAYNAGPTDVVTATDSATVNAILPSIALSKTVGTDPSVCADTDEIGVAEGTAVTYCFEVTNTGLTTLGFHDLDDSELGSLLAGFAFNLEPGVSVFITQTALITEATVNTATWTAYNAGPTDVVTATDSATVNILTSAISLAKTVGTNPSVCADTSEIDVAEGTAVTYCYEVTNTGEAALSLHDLEDSALGVILDGFPFTLMPGASVFVTQTAVITEPTINTATWTAYNPGPYAVAVASSSATVNILPAAISLTKTVGLDPSVCAETDEITVAAGTAVTYCYEVTNSGEVALSLHDLEDSELGALLTAFNFVLEPGASVFITQTAVITQPTINTATWTSYNPGPYAVATATATATVHILEPEDEFFHLYLPIILKP